MADKPNVVFVFGDQMRYQASGYAGDPNIDTPHLDALAAQSVNFSHAVSGTPVCCPARATLLTSQQPLTHGVFLNDVHLSDDIPAMGTMFKQGGYDTAWIGKWHVDGRGRSNYIPRESRKGFDFFHALECTHGYNESKYYADDDENVRLWDGYDVFAQTQTAKQYVADHAKGDKPFLLCMSWGPPHDPYQTAPQAYRDQFDPASLELRSNVPADHEEDTRKNLAGYYAHIKAMDDAIGDLRRTIDGAGIADDTVFVFWSDHGDMVGSRGMRNKQRPWDESIRVPLLIRDSRLQARDIDTPIDTVDLLPTLLGLCGLPKGDTLEGIDYTAHLRGEADPPRDEVVIACYSPFGQFTRNNGGKEFRGIRTRSHTYVRDLEGPWLLYDNSADPYQLDNLVGKPEASSVQAELESRLTARLAERGDGFEHGDVYVEQWGHNVDESGTVPYTN